MRKSCGGAKLIEIRGNGGVGLGGIAATEAGIGYSGKLCRGGVFDVGCVIV